MERSDSIKQLAAALNKAQAEMSGAKKGANNPFFKSKYADLNAVVDAVRIPFAENGLSYSQFPVMDENRVGVETILMHDSGEFIASTLMLPTGKLDAQAAGSAITYARRYSLQSIAGIPAEDDDGNAATVGGNYKQQGKPFNPNEALSKATRAMSSCDMNELAKLWTKYQKELKPYPDQLSKLEEVKNIRKAELTPEA